MDPIILIIAASLASGTLSLIAVWNRRPRKRGDNFLIQTAVLLVGSAAALLSGWLFMKALGIRSTLFALVITLLVTAWIAAVHTVIRLPIPTWISKVTKAELAVLRQPWTGVRGFGRVLRHTPLRHLGGRVYLAQCSNDSTQVLRGIQEDEEIHCWSLLLGVPWLMYWLVQGLWWSVAMSFAVQLLWNIYPVLHLRLTRGRMEHYRARHEDRQRRRVSQNSVGSSARSSG